MEYCTYKGRLPGDPGVSLALESPLLDNLGLCWARLGRGPLLLMLQVTHSHFLNHNHGLLPQIKTFVFQRRDNV